MTAHDGPGTRMTTFSCSLFLHSTTSSSSSSSFSSSSPRTHLHVMCSLVHLLHAIPFNPTRGSSHTSPWSMQQQQGSSVSHTRPFFPACLFHLGWWEPVLSSNIKTTTSCTNVVSRALHLMDVPHTFSFPPSSHMCFSASFRSCHTFSSASFHTASLCSLCSLSSCLHCSFSSLH